MLSIQDLLDALKREEALFSDVLAYIEEHYTYSPSSFTNGALHNSDTENQGSARVFSLAQQLQLSEADTCMLFAEHYRQVLSDPDGLGHQNIRQFMEHGWSGISFAEPVLSQRQES